MKKIFLVVLALWAATAVGVMPKGKLNLGGHVSFTQSYPGMSLNVSPNIGYAIADNVMLDLELSYDFLLGPSYTSSALGAGLSARYFIRNAYAGAGLIQVFQAFEWPEKNPKPTSSQTILILKAGLIIPIAEKAYLDLGGDLTIAPTSTWGYLEPAFGVDICLGIQVFL